MVWSARLGRFELRRAHAGGRAARSFTSAADALTFLRQQGMPRASARRLVHAAGASSRADGDSLRELALLLWRGTYVLAAPQPFFRVPPVEESEAEPEAVELEPTPPEEPDDGHPPAIVPPEYPRVASYIAQGLWTAVKEAERELDEQLHRGLPPMPLDQLPAVFRDLAREKRLSMEAAVHHATLIVDRLIHRGGVPDPKDFVAPVYREIAVNEGVQVQHTVERVAGKLDALLYRGDTDLGMLEGTLHSQSLPRALRETTDRKVGVVRDATNAAASSLDRLLHRGFDE
jgi:hypothetical protein